MWFFFFGYVVILYRTDSYYHKINQKFSPFLFFLRLLGPATEDVSVNANHKILKFYSDETGYPVDSPSPPPVPS